MRTAASRVLAASNWMSTISTRPDPTRPDPTRRSRPTVTGRNLRISHTRHATPGQCSGGGEADRCVQGLVPSAQRRHHLRAKSALHGQV